MRKYILLLLIPILSMSCEKKEDQEMNTANYTIKVSSPSKEEIYYSVEIYKASAEDATVYLLDKEIKKGVYNEASLGKPMDDIHAENISKGRYLHATVGYTGIQTHVSLVILKNGKEIFSETSDLPIIHKIKVE